MDHKPLESWVHPEGRVVLLGDACHPMLVGSFSHILSLSNLLHFSIIKPYVGQGAAMALEDAAVLGNLLSHLSSPSQLSYFLNTYERIRLPRTSDFQLSARAMQVAFHTPDGPARQARDNALRADMQAKPGKSTTQAGASDGSQASAGGDQAKLASSGSVPNKEKYATWFGYDADAQVDAWWVEEGKAYIEGALSAAR